MSAASANQHCLTTCTVCERELPALLLDDDPQNTVWECRGCGATYQGKLAKKIPPELQNALRPKYYFNTNQPLPQLDAELASFVDNLVEQDKELERRGSPRLPFMVNLPVMQLDENLFPVGEPIVLVSRNISARGISLLHDAQLTGKFAVQLDLPGKGPAQLLTRCVRCMQFGRFYEIAGLFERRL